MGGWDGEHIDSTCDAIYRFNIRTKEWEILAIKMPEKLNSCFALVCGKYVHLMGGDGEGAGGHINTSDGHWVIPLEMLLTCESFEA